MGGARATDPETSKQAYAELEESGTLSRVRLDICRTVAHLSPPPTAGEIATRLVRNRNNVATRLSELEDLGVVQRLCPRPCCASGKTSLTWQLTGNQPAKTPNRVSANQKLRARVAELEKENSLLREENEMLWTKADQSDAARRQGRLF